MSTEKLEIRKGGKLIETKFVYDEDEKGEYKEIDQTHQAIRFLFETCELSPEITLKDIFLLLNTELELFDVVIGNWCKDIVTEGLTKPEKSYVEDDEAIEYIELSYTPEYYKNYSNKNNLSGLTRLDLNGVGFARKKVKYFDWNNEDGTPAIEYNIGERTPWSLSFTSTNELINIPVKLSNSFVIVEDDYKKTTKITAAEELYPKLLVADNPDYSLGNILYSIIWELSFYGGPDSRDKKGEELKILSKEVREGKAKTVPFVFEE